MTKKTSNKTCEVLIYVGLAVAIIYFLIVLRSNITLNATLFMWITTMLGCIFYIHKLKQNFEEPTIDDARYWFVSCSAFVNYLISKK